MREELIGYVLGALDGPEQDRVREYLQWDPELQRELADLESELAPLQSARWEFDPPPQLAARTCALIHSQAGIGSPRLFDLPAVDSPASQRPASQRPASELGSGGIARSRWRLADVAVAAGILLMLGGLLSPSILGSREQARLNACQDNLRQFGIALPAWADRVKGWLPHIPATGNTAVAGFYGPQLVTAGLVRDHQTFVCPTSSLARQGQTFRVPSTLAVYLAQGARLADLQANMGGSYNYSLGYLRHGQLWGRQLSGQRFNAMMSDRPAEAGMAGGHRRGGVNILFQDGHVRWVLLGPVGTSGRIGQGSEQRVDWRELFVSDRGLVEAGRSVDDIVLAPSWARPVPPEFADLFSREQLTGATPVPLNPYARAPRGVDVRLEFSPRSRDPFSPL